MSLPDVLQDIKSLKDNQLTGRYYIPTIVRALKGTETLTANPLPTTWTGANNIYSSGSYTIESNMSVQGANYLSLAFNGNVSDEFRGLAPASAENTITITFPEAIKIDSFKTYIPDFPELNNIRIYGSNDKSSWSFLTSASVANNVDTLRTTTLTNVGDYKYYQFRFNVDATATVEVGEIQVNKYIVSLYANDFTIQDIPSPLSLNQRIMIKTPDYSNTGIKSNNLNGKSIDVLLLPNRYYELVYDGTKYLAKEVV